MRTKQFYIYIMTNFANTVIYTGVTNNLVKRVFQHKGAKNNSFTSRYFITKLVYYEMYDDPSVAIQREKQIKAGSRQKKIDLINSFNPRWHDLYDQIIL